MSVRQDKLVLLLDTGSSQHVRRIAAKQLADLSLKTFNAKPKFVQPQQVDVQPDLDQLDLAVAPTLHADDAWADALDTIAKVAPLLASKSADTRQAAAHALGLIAATLPPWIGDSTVPLEPCPLATDPIDVRATLQRPTLLASEGREYIAKPRPGDKTNRRKAMLGSIGLGDAVGWGDDVDKIVEAEDDDHVEAKRDTPPARTADAFEGLSARQIASLKRKKRDITEDTNKMRRLNDTSSSASLSRVSSPEKPDTPDVKPDIDGGPVIIDPGRGTNIETAPKIPLFTLGPGHSPWSEVALHLIPQLGDAKWQTRHGASLGLMEIIIPLGRSLGRGYDGDFLLGITCRLLELLVLDRFGDFVGDTVVAPSAALLDTLWNCMSASDDDLGSSTGAVMDLLCTLLDHQYTITFMAEADRPRRQLISRIFPFFRHSIAAVRLAVVQALQKLVANREIPTDWVQDDICSLVYQNLVLEQQPDIVRISMETFTAIVQVRQPSVATVNNWYAIAMTLPGVPLDQHLFVHAAFTREYDVDKSLMRGDLSLAPMDVVIMTRVAAAKGLAMLPPHLHDDSAASPDQLLAYMSAPPPPTYSEMALLLSRMQVECQGLLQAFNVEGKVHASIAALGDRRRKILASVGFYDLAKERYDVQVTAAIAGALLARQTLPVKLGGVIKAVMDAVKKEENDLLQDRAASSVAALIAYCTSPAMDGRPNPTNKVLKNLFTFVNSDTSITPAGLPDPPEFSAELLAKRDEERKFLMQLLDGSKAEQYSIPIPIKATLRQYQKEGVSWLAFLAKYQLHGILCDDMGLGKSLQTICIVGSKHYERAQRFKAFQSADAAHLPSLIVCPPTLVGHWYYEIQKFTESLRPLQYVGNSAHRAELARHLRSHDVVITSYDIVRNDIGVLGKISWLYCVLDEGHVIKNAKTKLSQAVKLIPAQHRLLLSGTPIQNNVLELWSLFDFLMPGFLGSERAFNERFSKPILADRDGKATAHQRDHAATVLEALHKQVLPFLLRRLKEDVLDDLPPKIIQDYYCELSDLQQILYDEFTQSQAAKEAGESVIAEGGSGQQHVFQSLQYLRKLCNHPALVLEGRNAAAIGTGKLQNMLPITGISHAPKLEALRQLLYDCGIGLPASEKLESDGHRVLVFCQSRAMLNLIETDLFKQHMPAVKYMRMDGATDPSRRHAIVQTYNADPSVDVLLLTTSVGGLGLNLTGADTVIFVDHDWNPMKDLQAMDRAHRLGQKRVVNVYRLITRGTLEEKIMGLQRFKLNIASSVVTQQNAGLGLMNTGEVLDLFQVSAEPATQKPSKAASGPASTSTVLEGLEDLPPESEYEDLALDYFLRKM
ncbi:TATA-binding protein-associated factor mot1 [Cryptotrichosporon argae]